MKKQLTFKSKMIAMGILLLIAIAYAVHTKNELAKANTLLNKTIEYYDVDFYDTVGETDAYLDWAD